MKANYDVLSLPMLAFEFKGIDDDFVRLTVDEVFGYPKEICYAGGYGAKGRLSIQADGFILEEVEHYFGTGELYDFMKQLETCYADVAGTATLNNTEKELSLECRFDKLGHIKVTGEFTKNTERNNRLYFDIHSDQTQVIAVLDALRHIAALFGDKRGVNGI
jgi:hypothetical protein